MQKIPTIFVRDETNRKNLTRDVSPGCEWVLAGEGTPTRKYDGTCVGYFPVLTVNGEILTDIPPPAFVPNWPDTPHESRWLARREVKQDKQAPPHYVPVMTDEITGKTVGWEPIEQSSFKAIFDEALANLGHDPYFGSYELCGPKMNKNPEGYETHVLVAHNEAQVLENVPRDYDGLREWLLAHDYEGIVFHHPDGRMAKIKKRDFR